MRQNAEIPARLAQDMAHHQPVQNSVGVVGNQDQRPFRGMLDKAPAHHIQRQAVTLDHDLPEIAPLATSRS